MKIKEFYLNPSDPIEEMKRYCYRDVIAQVRTRFFGDGYVYSMAVKNIKLNKVIYYAKTTPYTLEEIKKNIKLARKRFKELKKGEDICGR